MSVMGGGGGSGSESERCVSIKAWTLHTTMNNSSFHLILRSLQRTQQLRSCIQLTSHRQIHSSRPSHAGGITNILAGGPALSLQVKNITNAGIELADGVVLPSACIFLDGKVFLWDVPTTLWDGWGKEHFEIFETVVPKPGTYLVHDLSTRVLVVLNAFLCRNITFWNWQKCLLCTASIASISESKWRARRRYGHRMCYIHHIRP